MRNVKRLTDEIGYRLRIGDWREYQEVKISELAEKVGISGAYLSQIENGKRNPTIETLKNIAKGLGV